jgi:hypothetical protein
MPEEYRCERCGAPIDMTEGPDYRPERDDNGRVKWLRTVPTHCKKCRDDGFWERFKRGEQ